MISTPQHDLITKNQKYKIHPKATILQNITDAFFGEIIIEKNVLIRGDLERIDFGQYVIVREGTVIRPPRAFIDIKVVETNENSEHKAYYGPKILNFIEIGKNCIVEACLIENFVSIGDNSIIGERCVLQERSKVLPNSILLADTVVPPNAIFSGNPASQIGEMSASSELDTKNRMIETFKNYNSFQ